MQVYDIDWKVNMEEIIEILDEMPVESAACALEIPVQAYADMSSKERHDAAYDVFHHRAGKCIEFMELPYSITWEGFDDMSDDEITEHLADKYGFHINGWKCDRDAA